MTQLPVKECIKFGWDRFWQRPWFFIGAFIIIGIFNAGAQYKQNDSQLNLPAGIILLLALIVIAIAVIRIIINMGEKRLLLNAYEDVNRAAITDLWTPHPFWNFLLAQLAYVFIVVVGLILVIIPGIIWSLMFMFAPFIVIDKGLGPVEALKESMRITNGHKWQLFLLGLALIGINILGVICLLVGLLVSVPVSALATVYAYRFLEHQASEVATTAA